MFFAGFGWDLVLAVNNEMSSGVATHTKNRYRYSCQHKGIPLLQRQFSVQAIEIGASVGLGGNFD